MNRREFLVAGSVAAVAAAQPAEVDAAALIAQFGAVALDGHERLLSFEDDGVQWTVHEDRRSRDGAISFVSSDGTVSLGKRLEAAFAADGPAYLGLAFRDVALADADLLADRLLANGEPDPEAVRSAAPPLASKLDPKDWGTRLPWTNFVGTPQAGDTMPVFPNGRTRTYRPEHDFPELTGDALAPGRHEGLIGGWLPAVHKIIPRPQGGHYDLLTFADVDATGRFVVQTWHRTMRYDAAGALLRQSFGYSYADFHPRRRDPAPADFYRALFRFARRWTSELADLAPPLLPDPAWGDMVRHAFARELIVRPGGVYPKYGVVDRDYYGSEYDGFQDTFTSSLYANLEWGRFDQAREVFDQYFGEFVAADGMVDMRGPEVGQFGLTLSLIVRYLRYTGDVQTVARHRAKIRATAMILTELHDIALRLPAGDPGHGLIAGWNESDAALFPNPALWWKPYYANSAFAARGLRDLATVWDDPAESAGWQRRSTQLAGAVEESIRANIRRDLSLPYIGPLPGMKKTFREALTADKPSEQGWPHRVYAELLHADILPPDLATIVVDCLRGHGGTTMGIVSNIVAPSAARRDILGFISYGHAQQLLRMGRIDEYLLFLYAHRFHNHTPGGWVAGEVSDLTGGMPIFCIPAQLTIPLLVRWMLVFEDSDSDVLHLLKATPRAWLTSGDPIAISDAPTRWGRVDMRMQADPAARTLAGEIILQGKRAGPRTMMLHLRMPVGMRAVSVIVDGRPARLVDGAVRLDGRTRRKFAVAARYQPAG